jgi:hypothetical protein
MPPVDLAVPFPRTAGRCLGSWRTLFNIVVPEGVVDPPPAGPPVRKFLPKSFRAAVGRERPSTPFGVVDHEYKCTLKAASVPAGPRPAPPSNEVSWGDVLQFALRQPKLAEELGLLFHATIDLEDGHPLRDGGWIYTELGAAAGLRFRGGLDPDLVASYAARIPVLTDERNIFAPHLFGVATAAGAPPVDDDVIAESEEYDEGFAKVVHGAQPATDSVAEDEVDAKPAAKDFGIRLGWDDERIAVWMNRQLMADPNQNGHTPCCVAGYRVDVREANIGAPFTSLAAVTANLALDDIPLGRFDGSSLSRRFQFDFRKTRSSGCGVFRCVGGRVDGYGECVRTRVRSTRGTGITQSIYSRRSRCSASALRPRLRLPRAACGSQRGRPDVWF